MLGYNISTSIGGKKLLAVTQDDLSIEAVVKESITKDNLGVTQRSVVAHDTTITIAALAELNETGVTTQLDRDDVIELATKTGSAAQLTISYATAGGDTYSGTGIITGYTESSSASGTEDATIGLTIQISNFAKAS